MATKRGGLMGRFATYVGDVTVAAAVGGAVSLITSGVIQLIASRLRGTIVAFLVLGLLLLLFAAFTGFNSIKANLSTRRGFYSFNTTAMVVLFLAVASVIIFIGAKNNNRIDMTSTNEFSLSKQTEEILKKLDQKVEAVAFFVAVDPQQFVTRGPTLDLLEEYAHITSNFSYRIVDPELQPGEARRYNVNADTNPGTVVFTTQGRFQGVPTLVPNIQGQFTPNRNLERDFTQGILAITRAQQKTVYFMTRHGERDPLNVEDGTQYGAVGVGLDGDNYNLKFLDLGSGDKVVPADAAALLIASPKNDLLDEEVQPLKEYLAKGGHVLFLLDPLATPDALPKFREVLSLYGIELQPGTVVDLSSSVEGDPRSPIVRRERYNPLPGLVSPITRPLTDVTFFQAATGLFIKKGPATNPDLPNIFYNGREILILPLAVTNPILSWQELDPEKNERAASEPVGPLPLGLSIEARAPFGQEPPTSADAPVTKIVVFGDADFASNRFFTSFNNGDMFLNSVNWLAGDTELISVRPKLREPRLLIVTQGTWNFIRWSSLLILPLTIAGAGAVTWWRRR